MDEEKTVSSDKNVAAVQSGVLREYSSASPEPKVIAPVEQPAKEE